MKKLFLLAAAALLVAGMSSCNKLVVKQTSPVYSLTNSKVSNGELRTELETKGQIKGSFSGKFKMITKQLKGDGIKYVTDNTSTMPMRGINAAKAAAMYNALEGSGCDIMLAPVYNVQTKGRKVQVTVTGIGAKIKNVKQVPPTPPCK